MHLTWHMPRLTSQACGMSRRARGMASALRRRGHDVRFVVPLDATDVSDDALDGVPVRRIELPLPRPWHWSLQAHARRRRAEAAAAAVTGEFDVIVTCQPEFAAAHVERGGRAPVLVVACCSQLLYEPIELADESRRPLLRRLPFALNRALLQRGERLGLEAAAAVAFDSRMTCDLARERYELAPQRCHVISPTVDVSHFRPPTPRERSNLRDSLRLPADGFIVCWTGRMDDRKNVELLIEAVGLARERVDGLLLVGDGPERLRLATLVRGLGLSSTVRFAGMQADVAPYLQAADAFVLPSLVESFGIAAVEAMACGLPCIVNGRGTEAGCCPASLTPVSKAAGAAAAVRCGAAESVIPDVTGRVLGEGTARELADRLIELAGDARQRARLGAAGRERAVGEFAQGRDARQMERIVEWALTN